MNHPTVVFDVGGTLLHFNIEKLAPIYLAALQARGIPPEPTRVHGVLLALERELPTRSAERLLSLEKDLGKTFWEGFYADGFRRLGLSADVSDVVMDIRERFMHGEFEVLFEDAIPALDALAARKVRMGILSNFSPNLEEILRDLGIHRYFDFFIVSAIAGIEKPDPQIFHLAVAAAQRPREEIVYVGDSIFHDMDGARRAGIAGILVDRAEQYRDYAGARVKNLHELIPL